MNYFFKAVAINRFGFYLHSTEEADSDFLGKQLICHGSTVPHSTEKEFPPKHQQDQKSIMISKLE